MSRSLAKSGKAIATKLLKEKWSSRVQSTGEKGENEVDGSPTVTGGDGELSGQSCFLDVFLIEPDSFLYPIDSGVVFC